jgi:hypothetical protein
MPPDLEPRIPGGAQSEDRAKEIGTMATKKKAAKKTTKKKAAKK